MIFIIPLRLSFERSAVAARSPPTARPWWSLRSWLDQASSKVRSAPSP